MLSPPRNGSLHIHTGLSLQSLSSPSACKVLDPSNPHVGNSLWEETGSFKIFVLERKFAVGSYPSIQIYYALIFIIIAPNFSLFYTNNIS